MRSGLVPPWATASYRGPWLCFVSALQAFLCLHAYCFSRVWLFANPMDCSLPGFCLHGILQARTLEWVAILSFRASSQPRDGAQVYVLYWEAGSWWLVPPGKPSRASSSLHKPPAHHPHLVTSPPLWFCGAGLLYLHQQRPDGEERQLSEVCVRAVTASVLAISMVPRQGDSLIRLFSASQREGKWREIGRRGPASLAACLSSLSP